MKEDMRFGCDSVYWPVFLLYDTIIVKLHMYNILYYCRSISKNIFPGINFKCTSLALIVRLHEWQIIFNLENIISLLSCCCIKQRNKRLQMAQPVSGVLGITCNWKINFKCFPFYIYSTFLQMLHLMLSHCGRYSSLVQLN